MEKTYLETLREVIRNRLDQIDTLEEGGFEVSERYREELDNLILRERILSDASN